jgi:hypothetical protein
VLDGAKDAALRIRLLDGAETARALSPQDGVTTIDWDVSELRGHDVVLVLEDRSPTHGLAVDEVVLY